MKAGLYWVGDPCYVLDKDNGWDWGKVLDQTDYFSGDSCVITAKEKVYQVCVYNTAHGDGVYFGSDGKDYSVDAGLIGIIPINALPSIKGKYGDGDAVDNGHLKLFSEDFSCQNESGLMTFGDILIDTLEEEEDVCECCGNPL